MSPLLHRIDWNRAPRIACIGRDGRWTVADNGGGRNEDEEDSLFLSEMSTVSGNDLNLKLWNGARDGDYDAVVAAIADGGDINWKNYSHVSDNDI